MIPNYWHIMYIMQQLSVLHFDISISNKNASDVPKCYICENFLKICMSLKASVCQIKIKGLQIQTYWKILFVIG